MGREINKLHPRLQKIISQLQEECRKENLFLGIGDCFRTVAEQDALYAQGRTKPGSIITNAPGSSYSSQHQWGIAFDFYKNVSGHAYDDDAFFQRVGDIGKSLGLGWGGDWSGFVDRTHLYLPDWGSTTARLKEQYGNFENFHSSWEKSGAGTPSEGGTPSVSGSIVVHAGQIHANNFCGAGISADGIRGSRTKKAGIKVLQQALNLDYQAGLSVDGIWGPKSRQALGSHYVRRGEKQYLVTAAEILLMLKNYAVNGVESPGIFGGGLEQAVKSYQKAQGLAVDGVAGSATFLSLIG